MGLFVYTQKGSIISTVDLPTTEIIEPFKKDTRVTWYRECVPIQKSQLS